MTPEAMNRAIAEELGYYVIQDDTCPNAYKLCPPATLNIRFGWHETEAEAWADAGEWTSDLDACHEAEKHLPDEQAKRLYVDYLVTLMRPGEFTVMAAAPQRAKAFLRTIGKWKEGV